MVAKNDITGDSIATKFSSAYRDNWDAIFGKRKESKEKESEMKSSEDNPTPPKGFHPVS